MGKRRYPPLTPSEVCAILTEWSFKRKNQEGSHRQYEGVIKGQRKIVTVDMAEDDFDDFLVKSMISQSGLTREQFYGATKKTAKKASVPLVDFGEATAMGGGGD
jgi:predicted RNA binding protein YcfA (HicA-like mRNA interferase family)